VGVVLLDSGAIVGFLDQSDPFHAAADRRVGELAATETLIASAVTYGELLVGAELGHHDERLIRGFFDELLSDVAGIDRDVAEVAARLRGANPSLKMPDALILATAETYPADLVLCTDKSWRKLEGLTTPIEALAAGPSGGP
jgi:predicted nucleic acid-binding protein